MNSELSTITEEFRKSKTELTNILGVSSITDIADGLKQLRQIKIDIKAAASSELGVSIPDGTPFADWADFIDGTPPRI